MGKKRSLYYGDVPRPVREIFNTLLQVSWLCYSTFCIHFCIGFGIFVSKLSYMLSKANPKLCISPVTIRAKRSLKCTLFLPEINSKQNKLFTHKAGSLFLKFCWCSHTRMKNTKWFKAEIICRQKPSPSNGQTFFFVFWRLLKHLLERIFELEISVWK